MTTSGEGGPRAAEHEGWHLWAFHGTYYARRLKSSPPVVIGAKTPAERDAKIAAYLERGRAALDD